MTSSKPQNLISIHVSIRVDPSNIEPFLEALRPCHESCLREPECLYFDVFHDGKGFFRFVEVWAHTEDSLKALQLTKPYYEPYLKLTQPMWMVERNIEFIEQVPGWLGLKPQYIEGRVRD